MNRRESFETDGFVVVSDFCSEAECEALETELSRIIDTQLDALPPEHVFLEDKSDRASLKQLQQLQTHSPLLGDFMNGRVRELAEELLGELVVPKNLQYFNKPPGQSRATPPHQDGAYFLLEPCRAVTLWLALDAVDESNGCVRYIRDSHRSGERPHGRTATLGFSRGITDIGQEDLANEVLCAAEPGDLLAHHAWTIHRAEANTSPRSRRALGFIFYGESAREDAAAHAAYQKQLATELTMEGRI